MIAQLPNASHGGVTDKAAAKITGSGKSPQPLSIKPPNQSPSAPAPVIPFPENGGQQLASRAERRRAEAQERRNKRKESKKSKGE